MTTPPRTSRQRLYLAAVVLLALLGAGGTVMGLEVEVFIQHNAGRIGFTLIWLACWLPLVVLVAGKRWLAWVRKKASGPER